MKSKLEEAAKPRYWHDLTEEEKRAIHNPQDYPVISVIKAIPQKTLEKLDKSLQYLSMGEEYKPFMDEEMPWMKDFLWYKGEKKSKMACSEEGVSWDRMCAEYRIYYAARHTNKIKNPFSLRVRRFLKWIAEGKEYYKLQLD